MALHASEDALPVDTVILGGVVFVIERYLSVLVCLAVLVEDSLFWLSLALLFLGYGAVCWKGGVSDQPNSDASKRQGQNDECFHWLRSFVLRSSRRATTFGILDSTYSVCQFFCCFCLRQAANTTNGS